MPAEYATLRKCSRSKRGIIHCPQVAAGNQFPLLSRIIRLRMKLYPRRFDNYTSFLVTFGA